ncbi:type VII secretion system-associated protein [Streptomyces sp. SID12488]|uniref:type VII secretion system-associated protein n=1 Tax=Streptomyces sp. SID12488 TaxID=2706040 RepID=UPI0013D94375|nr:type VII secretion system-associated protein [Streptomyces sp. SID12488]NEA68404.1 type VII secretion system-associated protein [Streptomyces sp. SID12488]
MTSPSGPPADEPQNPAEADPTGPQGGPTSVLKGQEGFREPPEDYVKAAKVAPDHWLSVIDRHWNGDEDEPPPPWASLGRWRSDANGEIVEWEENPDYRPSPDSYGWAPPVSPVDAALQLVATGYASEELFALMLADAEVAVCVDEHGDLAVTDAQDGTEAVPVFSTSPQLDADRLPPHEVMSVPALLERLPEGREVLFLSSSAPVGQLVTVSALRESKADLERYEAEGGDEFPEPGRSAARPDAVTDLPDIATLEDRPDFLTDDQWTATRTAPGGPEAGTATETQTETGTDRNGS